MEARVCKSACSAGSRATSCLSKTGEKLEAAPDFTCNNFEKDAHDPNTRNFYSHPRKKLGSQDKETWKSGVMMSKVTGLTSKSTARMTLSEMSTHPLPLEGGGGGFLGYKRGPELADESSRQ